MYKGAIKPTIDKYNPRLVDFWKVKSEEASEVIMKLQCVWEHNGNDSLLYAIDLPGAYSRGESREAAVAKLPADAAGYLRWSGKPVPESFDVQIVQEAACELQVCDADSDVLFEAERGELTKSEYEKLKTLSLKSAADFLALYESVPDKNRGAAPARETFYGAVPRTAEEMYIHTKNVNSYYFGEIGVEADNEGNILSCRSRGFETLEAMSDFLKNPVFAGSYGEYWSLRKVLRRFIWHDRIHAKAMYRMAQKAFGEDSVPNLFCF